MRDFSLAESSAIVEYLEDTLPPPRTSRSCYGGSWSTGTRCQRTCARSRRRSGRARPCAGSSNGRGFRTKGP